MASMFARYVVWFQVNGTDVAGASHETAAGVLKGSGRTVTLLVAYRPEGMLIPRL